MAERKEDEQLPQPQSPGDIIASAIAYMRREQLAQRITTLTQEVASIKSVLTTYSDRLAAVEEATRNIPKLRSQLDEFFTLGLPMSLSSASCQDYYGLGYIDMEQSGCSGLEVEKTADSYLDDSCYDMSGKKILVIFNHKEFKSLSRKLYGTLNDVEALRSVFGRLLNFDVQVHNDLTRAGLWKILLRWQELDHRETACLFFAFLTHGDTGGTLWAADDKYEFKSVLEMFENHPTLVNKPRVFLVYTGRGYYEDFGTEVVDKKDDDTDINFFTPSHDDFSVMHLRGGDVATMSRRPSGSWMIQTLCTIINEKHRKLDFVRMATLVHKNVASFLASDVQQMGFVKGVPETTFTFTKRLLI